MEGVDTVGEAFDEWDREAKEEYGVLSEIMEGRMGRRCRAKAVDACRNYELANLFPARAVALGAVYVSLEASRLRIEQGVSEWVKDIGSGKVDKEDFEEVVAILRNT
ncbi:hypothetical protein XPA_006065 [Xanthoria parietina]